MNSFPDIFTLDGLPFIKSLLLYEQKRFNENFLKGSVFEEINIDFGLFPKEKVYPLYFAGDIREPKGKKIIMGINPGYKEDSNREEQEYLEANGSFEGYCNLFKNHTIKSSRYFSSVHSFFNRYYGTSNTFNWQWFHDNVINLELVPYHSKGTGGLRINDTKKFRDRYFEANLKILRYLDPTEPIFIIGFTSFAEHFNHPLFRDVISFTKVDNFWIGTIDGKYQFIAMPFLNRIKGGQDMLVESIKQYVASHQKNL